MSYTLIELCCGTAALAVHAAGVFKRPLVPYQGSKWRVRKHLCDLLASSGYTQPNRVVLMDVGPWGRAWQGLLDPSTRVEVLQHLRGLVEREPSEVYRELETQAVPEDLDKFTASFLWLQRMAIWGKAVGTRGPRWSLPGFNKTSAYGVAATERFGEVHPMGPSLVRTLEGFAWERTDGWEAHHASCSDLLFPVTGPTVVYLDPPYAGTTVYPDGDLSRMQVCKLAEHYKSQGAFVIVSEGTPVVELEGWQSRCLVGSTSQDMNFRAKSQEWITFSDSLGTPDLLSLLGG